MKKTLPAFLLALGIAWTSCPAAPASGKLPAPRVIATTPAEFVAQLPAKVYLLLGGSAKANQQTASAVESLGKLSKTALALLPEGATRPKATSQSAPDYPRDYGEGQAQVIGLITPAGEVAAVYCVKASQPVFGERACAAIARWKFKPARVNGEAAPVLFTQLIEFSIEQH